MKVYIVRVCRGDWDEVVSFNIGTFSTLEKAERVKEKWFEQIEVIMWNNPSPISSEEIEDIMDDELYKEKYDLYLDWKYDKMGKILENYKAVLTIEEVEVDKEDFNIFE